MRRTVIIIFVSALYLICAASHSYCETVNIDELIGQYSEATGVQRPGIENAYRYKDIKLSGIVKDVRDWNTFDERTDTSALYYRVVTEQQATMGGVNYEALIFYKDKASVEPLSKGQKIEAGGALLKIVDEVGSFSVWVFAGSPSDEDKVMFGL